MVFALPLGIASTVTAEKNSWNPIQRSNDVHLVDVIRQIVLGFRIEDWVQIPTSILRALDREVTTSFMDGR